MPGPDDKNKSDGSTEIPDLIAHYRILKRLGKGGMGEVFLGEDTRQHGRKVALKVLPPELTQNESRLRRFKQEARAVLMLNHPNILTIFEIGQSNSIYYIATEFIEGETLRQYLWRDPIKVDEALGIAIQVAMALEAAHAAGIVHRDVKPENIMLRPDRFVRDRFVKVLDFGLVKLTEREASANDAEAVTIPVSKTNPGAVLGTTGYMSPEQAQGEPIDVRTDIFSLGVVLYEMLAGRPPFTGPTDSHVRVSIIDHDPPPLMTQSAEVPRHLERIVSKALAKDKAKRYQTITDFKIDLEQLREELQLSNSETKAQSQSPAETRATIQTAFVPSVAGNRSSADTEPLAVSTNPEGNGSLATRVARHKAAAISIVAILLFITAAAIYFYTSRRTIDSVAVLPFVNDSNDPNAEYLSDGITESIIRRLSHLPNLKVMSRTAVFRFKDKSLDPQEVGRNFKVGAVLVGRLVKQGDRLIIKTELIDVADGSQLWGAEYNNSLADIFSVEDEISRSISETLRLKITGADEEKLAKRYTKDAEAYELYLKGRYYWNKRNEEGLRNGIKYFRQAEDRDPRYALAYSGLADSYSLLSDIGKVKPDDEMPKARAAAQRAVDIDPTLSEAYTSRGFVKLAYDWDWLGAEADFKKAIELNAKYPTAHQWYASYFMQMGKFERAKEEIHEAKQLDPFTPIISANLGHYSYYERRYDDAIEHCNQTLKMVPNFWVARHYRAQAYTLQGRHELAIEELRDLIGSPGEGTLKEGAVEGNPELAASLGFAYGSAGKREDAQAILNRLLALSGQRYVSGLYFAIIYTGLKQNDRAIEYLNKAFESKHPGLVLIRVDPIFDGLRSDDRFKQLVGRFEPIP
ncbi:MAG: protein kinase [Pyrinomonadaceae bacterium]|nr:protein kinase [Pyrinomonadaceae bacterium]